MQLGITNEESIPEYYGDAQSSGSWNPIITFGKTRVTRLKGLAKEEYV